MLVRASDVELAASSSDAVREKTWRLVHRLEAEDALRQNREQSVSVLHKGGQKSEPRTWPPFTPESQSSLRIPAKTERKDRGETGGFVGRELRLVCSLLQAFATWSKWRDVERCFFMYWWRQISILVWVAQASNMNIYLHWKDRSSTLHPRAQQDWSLFTDTLTWLQHLCTKYRSLNDSQCSLHGPIFLTMSLGLR